MVRKASKVAVKRLKKTLRGTGTVFHRLKRVVQKRKEEDVFSPHKKHPVKRFTFKHEIAEWERCNEKIMELRKITQLKTKQLEKYKPLVRHLAPLIHHNPLHHNIQEKNVFNSLRIRPVSTPEKMTSFHRLFLKKKKQASKEKIEQKVVQDVTRELNEKQPKKLFGIVDLKPVEKPHQELPKTDGEIAKKIIVETIMSKNPIYIDAEDTVEHALEHILQYNIRGLPVIENDKVIGLVEERDIINFFKKKIPMNEGAIRLHKKEIDELSSSKVKVLLNQKLIALSTKDSLEKAIKAMQENDVGRIVVLEKNKLVGIVTRDDVVKAIIRSTLSTSSLTSEVMRTDIDRLQDLVEEKGRITTQDASKILHIEKETIEEWSSILERHNLISVEYPIVGTVELVKKE
jgi:CBS domain-containing protein